MGWVKRRTLWLSNNPRISAYIGMVERMIPSPMHSNHTWNDKIRNDKSSMAQVLTNQNKHGALKHSHKIENNNSKGNL